MLYDYRASERRWVILKPVPRGYSKLMLVSLGCGVGGEGADKAFKEIILIIIITLNFFSNFLLCGTGSVLSSFTDHNNFLR